MEYNNNNMRCCFSWQIIRIIVINYYYKWGQGMFLMYTGQLGTLVRQEAVSGYIFKMGIISWSRSVSGVGLTYRIGPYSEVITV